MGLEFREEIRAEDVNFRLSAVKFKAMRLDEIIKRIRGPKLEPLGTPTVGNQ